MSHLAYHHGRLLGMLVLLALLTAWSLGPSSFGQDEAADAVDQTTPADPDAEAAPAAAAPDNESLGSQIFKAPESSSDWFALFFYALLAIFSIFAATVTLERLVNLRRQRVLPSGFESGLTGILGSSTPTQTELSELCDKWPSPVARILAAGLTRCGRPLPEVEKSIEDAAVRELSEMRSKHRPLNVVGSTAPLVGLLGTVVGMIFAFQISSQLGLGKAEQLARGIYLALLTTAGGMTFSIRTLFISACLIGRVERFFRQIDQVLMPAIPFFTSLE